MAILGIDLGTTNSLGAIFLDGKVELIPNKDGEYLTPSVVSVDIDNNVYVGNVAKERLITDPLSTVFSFKRNMGSDNVYRLNNRAFSSEELSSFVIKSIVEDAKRFLADRDDVNVDEVVISVPAYFRDKQRVATEQAGALAGVKVHRIINEPSAAALAAHNERKQDDTMLVFDFGGGTLDVSVVDCFDNVIEIISVAGDNRLGGDDFNEVIAEAFLKHNSLNRTDLTETEYRILIKNSEKCKRELTENNKGTVRLNKDGKEYSFELTNELLMEEAGWIFNRIKSVLEQALRNAELLARDIGVVIMAGGSSNMPLVQTFIRLLFKESFLIFGSGEELIARGVGLASAIIEREEGLKEIVMTDICPFSLGTSVSNKADPDRPYMSTIISRNNALPCSRSRKYHTSADFQKRMVIDVYQGENAYADENVKLGELIVDVKPRLKGEESIDVRFTYDINGVLVVDITVDSTGEKISKVISNTLTGDDLDAKINQLNAFKVRLVEDQKNDLMREKLQRLYVESIGFVRNNIGEMIERYDMLQKENDRAFRKYKKELEEILDAIEKRENIDVFGFDIDPDDED